MVVPVWCSVLRTVRCCALTGFARCVCLFVCFAFGVLIWWMSSLYHTQRRYSQLARVRKMADQRVEDVQRRLNAERQDTARRIAAAVSAEREVGANITPLCTALPCSALHNPLCEENRLMALWGGGCGDTRGLCNGGLWAFPCPSIVSLHTVCVTHVVVGFSFCLVLVFLFFFFRSLSSLHVVCGVMPATVGLL